MSRTFFPDSCSSKIFLIHFFSHSCTTCLQPSITDVFSLLSQMSLAFSHRFLLLLSQISASSLTVCLDKTIFFFCRDNTISHQNQPRAQVFSSIFLEVWSIAISGSNVAKKRGRNLPHQTDLLNLTDQD